MIYQERDKVLNMQRVEDFNLEQLAKDVFRHDVSKRQDNLTQEQLAEYIYSNISFKFEGDTSQLNLKQHDNVIDFY